MRPGAVRPRQSESPALPERLPAQGLDRLMYAAAPLHDALCRCVVDLDGRLDAGRLARAVELSLAVAPVLGCRYRPLAWRPRWERSTNGAGATSFREVALPDGPRPLDALLGEPIDATAGPQVAVRLVRGRTDVLVVKLTHMVADAGGTLDYVRLLADLYRRLGRDPGLTATDGAGPDRGGGQILRRVGVAAALRGCLRLRYPPSPWGFPAAGTDLSGRVFPLRRVDAARTGRIRAYGRERRASVTDVLATAFYRSLAAVVGPPAGARLPMQLTVDLRRYLPSGRADTVCNLTGTCYPRVRHDPAASFEETLAAVCAAGAAARAGDPWLGGVLAMELGNLLPGGVQLRVARTVMRRQIAAGRAHPFFANLGVIEPAVADFGDAGPADITMFGPVPFPPNCLVTAHTFGGVLSITSGYADTAVSPELVDRLLDTMVAELPG